MQCVHISIHILYRAQGFITSLSFQDKGLIYSIYNSEWHERYHKSPVGGCSCGRKIYSPEPSSPTEQDVTHTPHKG